MTKEEAISECQRWLDYLESEKNRAEQLAILAGKRRKGLIDAYEARDELKIINANITVYDGALLGEAVKLLVEEITCQK